MNTYAHTSRGRMAKRYDVRAVANIVLDEATKSGRKITNLHLNKILYFMHVSYIAETDCPLVSAKIEAWQYGPVFREIYGQFKRFGDKPITARAVQVDYDSGEHVIAHCHMEEEVAHHIRKLARLFSGVPAGVLVDVSHDSGGAWHQAWHHAGPFNIGMEITEEMIRELDVELVNQVKGLQ